MKMNKDEYQALEDIVGPEYINQQPVIMETYNQVWGSAFFFDDKHSTRPAAVLLPADTRQISEAVKVCNKHGIMFKAFSSGFDCVALALESEKAIFFDLRRMNRILEIDPKNMRAVVEPYVSVYKLQMEAAKHGLYLGAIGGGYSAGVVSTECCHHGCKRTMVFTSGYGRNILGAEWVLPTGEILELGSGDNGSNLFSADGPGFSIRGILRGRGGANGGHGVITKVSAKLYPWYGPPEWENTKEDGEPPVRAQIDKVPAGFKVLIVTFPTLAAVKQAAFDFCQADILYTLATGLLGVAVLPEGNDEEWAMMQKSTPEVQDLATKTMVLIIGGGSDRELEYREKCVMAISEKLGGRCLPQFNEPRGLARAFMDLMWSTGAVPLRTTGDMLGSSSNLDGSPDMLEKVVQMETEITRKYEQEGLFVGTGKSKSGLHWRPLENLCIDTQGISLNIYDSHDPASLAAGREFITELFDPRGKFRRFGIPSRGGCLQIESVTHVHQNWGPLYDNFDTWLQKIKRMLDPNSVADWSAYIPPEYLEKGDYIPPSFGKKTKI